MLIETIYSIGVKCIKCEKLKIMTDKALILRIKLSTKLLTKPEFSI